MTECFMQYDFPVLGYKNDRIWDFPTINRFFNKISCKFKSLPVDTYLIGVPGGQHGLLFGGVCIHVLKNECPQEQQASGGSCESSRTLFLHGHGQLFRTVWLRVLDCGGNCSFHSDIFSV